MRLNRKEILHSLIVQFLSTESAILVNVGLRKEKQKDDIVTSAGFRISPRCGANPIGAPTYDFAKLKEFGPPGARIPRTL